MIDKVYAGVLSGALYQPETKQFNNFMYTRVGAAIHWKMSKKLTYYSWTFAEYETISQVSYGLATAYVQYVPHRKWIVNAGFSPTLTALQHRPHPASHFGQFEPSTKGRFPGAAPGVMVRYLPTENSMIGGGLSLRQNMPEYQLSGTVKNFRISGFYQVKTQTTGIGFDYKNERFSTTVLWKSNDAIANLNTFMIHRKQHLLLYSDFGYSLPNKCVVRLEGGILKLVQAKYLKALFGIGYAYETKSVKSYLLISL